uniref:Late embryogenesis abundant protein LEA-2 subgroup domain-containing protein n=1 Tax=Kalanchoe fedtschenkoi TaxID=63787 RepID=A0A7N0RDI1_KALFE
MADRIHPDDPEAPPSTTASPSAPLVPPGHVKSDQPDHHHHDHHRAHTSTRARKKPRSCCCRVFCWTISIIIILIVAIAITAGILYLIFRPKLPDYSIDSLRVTELALNPDATLSASFTLNVTAENPNTKIGIYYLRGSRLSAWYEDTELCNGSLPAFYQGHENTTVMDVVMSGRHVNGTRILSRVQEREQASGSVPLSLRANVPVRIKWGSLKLMKMKFRVRCKFQVDALTANTALRITSSSCNFRLKL